MQWRDIRRLWLCFEVLAVLRWTFVLDILEIRLTVASALKHDFGGCLQTIFWEEVAFYSRSIQPPESGALSGCCSQHGPGQDGSTQDKAVSTAALRVRMLWNTAVFRTEVLLMRHQPGCMAPGSSFMSIDAAHLACADSRNFSGVEFSKQFSSLRNDFFFSNVPQGPKDSFIGPYCPLIVWKLLLNPCIEMQILYTENESVRGWTGKRNGPRWPVRHMNSTSHMI